MKSMEQKAKDRRQRERRRNYASPNVLQFIENQSKLNERIELALFGNENETGIVKDVKEMKDIFTSVGGFKRISALLLKGIIIVGAGIGGLYVIVEFFRKVSK